jgi:ABC-type antimicrobial peptide transport system permease subunit
VRILAKAFYLKLAWNNIRRNRRTFYPYILTTAIISGVFLLIGGLLFSGGLNNLPTGGTAIGVFAFGLVVFAIFAFFFMVYINNFIVGRRKKEFGLYGILGLERRHVGRVLVWENFITLGIGVLLGAVIALVFGRLLFLILLKMIHAVAGSVFSIAPVAYIATLVLFFAVFVVTSLLNLRQVRLSSPIQLINSEKRGEKDSKLIVPLTVFGILCLIAAYYYAWSIIMPGVALGVFFLLAILVIIATNILFTSGSIVALKALRANRKLYYKPRNFIAIGGMFQRMRQNAKSLATICILSTMLIVTVSGTLSLYLGQEAMLTGMYPYDVTIKVSADKGEQAIRDFDNAIVALAKDYDVTVSADKSKLIYELPADQEFERNNYIGPDSVLMDVPNLVWFDNRMRFDVDGTEEDCLRFMGGLEDLYHRTFPGDTPSVLDVFVARQAGYGLYGGLLFLGVFFGILFLAVTVLIIYFKQISEGYEDKAQFAILQKVGMDDAQVKATINRQVLWVFFIPLGMTILHMIFASKIMARMLQTFMLYDWGLVLCCIGGVCVVFALLYLVVYRLTARVYYRIVKW